MKSGVPPPPTQTVTTISADINSVFTVDVKSLAGKCKTFFTVSDMFTDSV